MPPDTTVPREKVEALAANIRELLANKARQQALEAQLIRACVKAIRRKGAPLGGHVTGRPHIEARKRQKEDHDKALLHLEWLATQLENNASGTLTGSEPPDAA